MSSADAGDLRILVNVNGQHRGDMKCMKASSQRGLEVIFQVSHIGFMLNEYQ